jgi:hypothetical protein
MQDGGSFTGLMQVMDTSGHTEIKWNKNDAADVETARAMFNAMRDAGKNIFEVTGRDQQGRRASEFNPQAERYMVMPHLVGG